MDNQNLALSPFALQNWKSSLMLRKSMQHSLHSAVAAENLQLQVCAKQSETVCASAQAMRSQATKTCLPNAQKLATSYYTAISFDTLLCKGAVDSSQSRQNLHGHVTQVSFWSLDAFIYPVQKSTFLLSK